jgi:hypothetical protein
MVVVSDAVEGILMLVRTLALPATDGPVFLI